MDNTPPSPVTSTQAAPADSVTALRTPVKPDSNLMLGLVAGSIAALIGAAVWATVTALTKYQIGWMAIGVGFLVGFAVQKFGKGETPTFAYMGAALSLLGCMLGNLLAVVAMVAIEQNTSFFTVLPRLTLPLSIEIMKETFQPMDLLFYGIALYQGYKLSVVPPAPAIQPVGA